MKRFLTVFLTICLCVVPFLASQAENNGVYVLMNIPYEAFYASEVTVGSGLDAVSSSTLMKSRTGTLSGGSYHVDPEGSDISGVIFPVYVEDASVLATLGGVEITDESSVDITVTNKGQDATTTYAGKEALYEAPSYSYYVLSEAPAQYKTLTVADGASFSAVNTEPVKVDASAEIFYDKHADVAIRVTGMDSVLGDSSVSAVILSTDDGTSVGLRHIANLWRGVQFGFKFDSAIYEALKGKMVTGVQYLTVDGNYCFETALCVSDDQRLVALSDSYVELFPVFADEIYKDYWYETLKSAGVAEDELDLYYAMFTENFMGRLYGQEAIEAFGADPAAMVFDCYFENGITLLKVNGNVISGYDEEGNEVFSHVYTYLEDANAVYFGMEIPAPMHIYVTDDADAGAFTYFAFADDTTKDTQHIEFRNGANLEGLTDYTEGEYAYWLASGIQKGAKESLVQTCITLFVTENLSEEAE